MFHLRGEHAALPTWTEANVGVRVIVSLNILYLHEVYKVLTEIKRSVCPECILRNTRVRADEASVEHGFKCESRSAIKRETPAWL